MRRLGIRDNHGGAMHRMRGTGLMWVCLLLVTPSAEAARTRAHEAAESSVYQEKIGGMVGRGLLNALTGFVDVLVNTVNETKAGPPFIGTLTGLAKGTGCGLLRTGSGAVDLVTFWVPGFNGFPVSDSYENCLATWRADVLQPEPGLSVLDLEPELKPQERAAQPSQPPRVWKK
jgi:putative exosortase-associated protein (TIGR04073 family)